MFLRKTFNSKHKSTWVVIDFIVVILGVYGAFWLQNNNELKMLQNEKGRILTSLKYEVEVLRYRMFETALGAKSRVDEMEKIISEGKYESFLNIRFIEPQYDYQTIGYALNHQNTNVIDFKLYNDLQLLYVEIRKIEYTERLMTQIALNYSSLPAAVDKNDINYKMIFYNNYDNYRRLLTFTKDRMNISNRIVDATTVALKLVNSRLGKKKSKKIEEEIIKENMHLAESKEQAVYLVQRFFPHFSKGEIIKLYYEVKKVKQL